MRLEEMTTDDIRQLATFCDTAVMTLGGASWRPTHLPIGTSWFILRRLRDLLEGALGGRMITLPVLGINIQGGENDIFQIPKTAASNLISHSINELVTKIPIRYCVFLTDSLAAEEVFHFALEQLSANDHIVPLTFVWWRDGFKVDQEDQAQPVERSGEIETSLLLSIAKRLVDLEQKSAVRHAALQASEQTGNAYWTALETSLLERVQSMWAEGNSQTVV